MMAREFRIKYEDGQTMEETADWLAMAASSVLHELFPDQWREGMMLMVQRINFEVAEDQGNQ